MRQFKVICFTAVSHLSRLISNLFILKQIASSLGPGGMGFLGNFMSLCTLAATLAGGGILSGIIKYIAEYSSSTNRQLNFAGSALMYSTFFAIVVLILGSLFINEITYYIFRGQRYQFFIYFFLISQCFVALNNYSYGLLNGYKKNNLYALVIVSGNVIAIIVSYFSIKYYGAWGAVIAIMSPVLCPFIPIMALCLFSGFLSDLQFNSTKSDSVLLSKYSFMMFFSAICFPIVEIYIRNKIVQVAGIEEAGFWQAITRLSSAYLSFYSLFFTFYFVPLIAGENDFSKISTEVKKIMVFNAGLFLLMVLIYVCVQNFVIQFVFSKEFLPISDLFILQMLGDFFRVVGWVVGFVIIAKAMTRLYILSELIQGLMFVLMTSIALNYSSALRGVIIAHVLTCFLYCVISLSLFFYMVNKKKRASSTKREQ